MGIGWSVHKNNGWRGQLERTRRWHQRIKAIQVSKGHNVKEEDLDFVYSFFQNCFHLREWVAISGDVSSQELSDFMMQNEELRVCRDIANGTKHFHITRPSIDASFSIGREAVPFLGGPGHKWFVIAGNKYDLFALADRCMELWNSFLSKRDASSEHLYPGFSIFARDVLRGQINAYRTQLSELDSLLDGDSRNQLSSELEKEKGRLLAAFLHVLDGPFSFDGEERETIMQELKKSLDDKEHPS